MIPLQILSAYYNELEISFRAYLSMEFQKPFHKERFPYNKVSF